ncbi:MAG: rRNA cytosine-C5-methyltransferase [Porphyromonadaceae bacterium CG2_30_38_12]|nr:MAG: rRNA cytosine-C5-methyltransferase [Porphyromonadaceae bacterium CG2_30_38_12]
MVLPEKFVERTMQLLGNDYILLEQALAEESPTSIRFNDKVAPTFQGEHVAWCSSGIYLYKRPLFTADPLFHAGAYYVQEASSMFLQQAIIQYFSNATAVLDLCAAPGGKSTLLAQTLAPGCLLVCNETVRSRAFILAENMSKWGKPNVVVSNNEPKHFSGMNHFFDAIVVDAPCSGEGMFRKDSQAISEWSLQNVAHCVQRQQSIMSDCWQALKPGGYLVYSTCTFNRDENENNIAWLCETYDATCLEIDISDFQDVVHSDYGYRFYPHRIKGEGFFLSIVQKKADNRATQRFKKQNNAVFKPIDSSLLPHRLLNSDDFLYFNTQQNIVAYTKTHKDELFYLQQQLGCMLCGLTMYDLKGKNYLPTAQVALSKSIDKTSCATTDVDYKMAIAYLKHEAINLPDAPLGFLLITYNKVPLGWVKNIGNRCNNMYPQNWRIRMNL